MPTKGWRLNVGSNVVVDRVHSASAPRGSPGHGLASAAHRGLPATTNARTAVERFIDRTYHAAQSACRDVHAARRQYVRPNPNGNSGSYFASPTFTGTCAIDRGHEYDSLPVGL